MSGHSRCIVRWALCAMVYCLSSPAWAGNLSELDLARQSLSAARAAHEAAVEEYRKMLGSGGLGRTEQRDFEEYLTRLKDAVARACDRIDGLGEDFPELAAESGCDLAGAGDTGPVSFPEETTEQESIARMDHQLGTSMSEFDELLLREMEQLKRQRSGSPDAAGGSGGGDGEGSATGQGTGQSGQESSEQAAEQEGSGDGTQQGADTADTDGTDGPEAQGEQAEGRVASRQQESGQRQQGAKGSSETSSGSTSRTDAPPADDDDDIVARQLREAAENETDPVLREKLWEEYRRYKADTAAKTSKNTE